MAAALRLLFFARLRECIGHGEEEALVPETVDRVDRLIDWLAGRGAGYEVAFADRTVLRCAVNQAMVASDARIQAGDEVAFFPPVTGG